jgi:WD40 repeat protein/tetratricopeptide (TPR) repeat protein
MPTSSGSRDYGRFDALAEEFAARYRRGERPSLQEYIDRLPEMADEIREMFPALVAVQQAEEDARGGACPAPVAAARHGQIGDYEILREIGRGGMGVVYEAEQISLGRRVALKVLPRHVVGDRKAQERFLREAKAAARLHHTNIVPVFEVGRDRDVSFYAMQLIQGQGLEQVIDELRRLREPGQMAHDTRPARPEALATVGQGHTAAASILRKSELGRMAECLLTGRLVTEPLELPFTSSPSGSGPAPTERFDLDASAAREPGAGRAVRATTPPASESSTSAVMPGGAHVSEMDTSGRRQPYFRSVAQIGRQAAQGLAHAHARGIIHRDIKPSNLLLDTAGVVWITDFGLAKADDDGLTATGDILGTLRYLAPERFRGDGDARADIYALGLTLYELLTLRPAYDSSDRLKLVEQIKAEDPPGPRSVDGRIPRDLETIVLKAIDKDPAGRYPTADAIAEDLRRFLADEPIKARQVSTTERYWRWARRNPVVAALGAVLTAVLVMVSVGSLLAAARFANLADDARNSADVARNSARAERGARLAADQALKAAEAARAGAQAETYRAMLSEVRALRAGHRLGWRDEALDNLARLAVMPTSRRDLAELRTEAVVTVGEFGVKEVARFAVSGWSAFTIEFSPDSQTLVTACDDGTLDFWDVAGRKHLRRLVGVAGRDHGHLVRGGLAHFLPDGDLAFLDTRDGVAFLDASGAKSTRPPIPPGAARAIKLLSDRQGRWLALGRSGGRIDAHDLAAGTLVRSFEWPDAGEFAISPDGRWLALQRSNGSVALLPTGGQGDAFTLPLRGGYLPALTFSPDGTTIAGMDDRAVAIWNLASKQELLRLTGHKESVSAIAFSPDGSLVATSCGDAITRIWDAHDGRPLASLPGPAYMQALGFSPDGTYLAAAAVNAQVCLYQLEGRREQRRLVGHKFGVNRLVFHPSMPRLVSSSDDHAVLLWDANKAQVSGRWTAQESWVTGLAISPDGSLIASARGGSVATEDSSIRLWDAETGVLKKKLPGTGRGVWGLAFDPTGRRIAAGDDGGTVSLLDVDTGQIVRRESLGGSLVSSLVFLNDGRSLLVGQDHGAVSLFALDRSDPPRRVNLPDGCTRLVVDRRRDRAIVGDSNGSLIALSLPELAVVHRLEKQHDDPIRSLALSPDGLLLATAGRDRRVVLRDPATLAALLTFPSWTGPLQDVAFDTSGQWIAFAGTDSEIALWNLSLLRDELAAFGLAWDQPAPRSVPVASLSQERERARHPVPVIGPSYVDRAEFQTARSLLNSGAAAFRQGRYADAAVNLQQASERFQKLRRNSPTDTTLARSHGMSLGFLGSTSRELKRPVEALAHFRESLAVYDSMKAPQAVDLYNMACGFAMISALDDRLSPREREKLQARAVRYLRQALDPDNVEYLALISDDRDLDPLRDRADFRGLMADLRFPRDPFAKSARPSALETPRTRDPNASLAKNNEAHELLATGLTREAISVLDSALALNPDDTLLLQEVTTLQAWFGQDAELAATCRRAIEAARGTNEPKTADRTAKAYCMRPSNDKAHLDAALALARRAVTLGKDNELLPWFQMGVGMAEFRSGNDAAADEALRAAADAAKANSNYYISDTTAFYRAMILFRQGKPAEARRIATEAASRMKPLPADENNPLAGGAAPDDLILWMACKEAKALIKLDAASVSPSGHTLPRQ